MSYWYYYARKNDSLEYGYVTDKHPLQVKFEEESRDYGGNVKVDIIFWSEISKELYQKYLEVQEE